VTYNLLLCFRCGMNEYIYHACWGFIFCSTLKCLYVLIEIIRISGLGCYTTHIACVWMNLGKNSMEFYFFHWVLKKSRNSYPQKFKIKKKLSKWIIWFWNPFFKRIFYPTHIVCLWIHLSENSMTFYIFHRVLKKSQNSYSITHETYKKIYRNK
jgi:hypothetical protein